MDKKYIISTLVIILLMGVSVYAAPTSRIERTILPEADSTYDLGSNANRWANIYGDTIYGDGSNLTGVSGSGIENLNSETLGSIGDVTTTTLAYGSMLVWDTSAWISSSTLPYLETEWDKLYNATTTLNGFTNNQTNWNTAYGWGDWSGEGFITDLSGFTTADLSENTNLYFTNTRVADYINASSTMPVGNWNDAYSWGDWSGEGFITLTSLSGSSPIDYNNGTGDFSFDFSLDNTWTGGNIFTITTTTNATTTGSLYIGDDLTVVGTASSTTGLFTQGELHIGTNGTIEGTLTLPALGVAAGTFIAVNAAGDLIATTTPSGGGSSTFLGLTDTPASFASNGSKFVKVNAAEDALEFVDSGLFEIDISGGLQPVTNNLTDNYYELDVNDDIQPLVAP